MRAAIDAAGRSSANVRGGDAEAGGTASMGVAVGMVLSPVFAQGPCVPEALVIRMPVALRPCSLLRLENSAADLVALDRLKERLEVAFAEALVTLPLDELEEDRTEQGLAEDL